MENLPFQILMDIPTGRKCRTNEGNIAFLSSPLPFQGVANRLKCASEDAEKRQYCVLLQHRDGFEKSQLNLDRLNLTHTCTHARTHAIAHALAATVIRLSANIIWVE